MRTLVFSDSHLESTLDEKKYRFLESLIKNADQVIINGDFWDGFFITFSQFVNSPYRHLFPLLKEKNTVYLTGNHDSTDLIDSRADLFSIFYGERFEMPVADKLLIFEHGHLQVPIFKHENPILKKARWPISVTLNSMEHFIIRHMGRSTTKLLQKSLNEQIKKTIKPDMKDHHIFICGHTHLSEFNLAEQFINIGVMKHGLAQYLIIENDTIIPKEEWYG